MKNVEENFSARLLIISFRKFQNPSFPRLTVLFHVVSEVKNIKVNAIIFMFKINFFINQKLNNTLLEKDNSIIMTVSSLRWNFKVLRMASAGHLRF